MTYANDCIEIQQRERTRGLKRIERHTEPELNAAIEKARRKFGDDFWMLLHAIDAYQERRKRRTESREQLKARLMALRERAEDDFNWHTWSDN